MVILKLFFRDYSYKNVLISLISSKYLGREAPQVQLHPNEPQKLKVGESARITCRLIAGIPYATITWARKDNRPMSSRVTEDYPGVITFREASLADSGEYVCRGENSVGFTTATASIEIIESPIITLKPNKTQLSITEGDELQIHCSAIGKPTPTVHFKYPKSSVRPVFK